MKCRTCINDAHPLYRGLCEDCWASQPANYDQRIIGDGGISYQGPLDERWHACPALGGAPKTSGLPDEGRETLGSAMVYADKTASN